MDRVSESPLHIPWKHYDIEDLSKRRKEHLLMLMYEHQYNTDFLEENRPDMALRSHNVAKFKIKTTKIHRLDESPFYRGIYLWDGLPVELRSSVCKKHFKTSIRGYLY